MTLRWPGVVTVPMTGPRSAAVAAPQRIGSGLPPADPGCEVRTMWREPGFFLSIGTLGQSASIATGRVRARAQAAGLLSPSIIELRSRKARQRAGSAAVA